MKVITLRDATGSVRYGILLGEAGKRKGQARIRVLIIADCEVKIVPALRIEDHEPEYKGKPYPLTRALLHIKRINRERKDCPKRTHKAAKQIKAYLEANPSAA